MTGALSLRRRFVARRASRRDLDETVQVWDGIRLVEGAVEEQAYAAGQSELAGVYLLHGSAAPNEARYSARAALHARRVFAVVRAWPLFWLLAWPLSYLLRGPWSQRRSGRPFLAFPGSRPVDPDLCGDEVEDEAEPERGPEEFPRREAGAQAGREKDADDGADCRDRQAEGEGPDHPLPVPDDFPSAYEPVALHERPHEKHRKQSRRCRLVHPADRRHEKTHRARGKARHQTATEYQVAQSPVPDEVTRAQAGAELKGPKHHEDEARQNVAEGKPRRTGENLVEFRGRIRRRRGRAVTVQDDREKQEGAAHHDRHANDHQQTRDHPRQAPEKNRGVHGHWALVFTRDKLGGFGTYDDTTEVEPEESKHSMFRLFRCGPPRFGGASPCCRNPGWMLGLSHG